MLFPEGTSSDGTRVLPFRSALFGVAQLRRDDKPIAVQPVAISYTRLDGIPLGRYWRPLFAWFGDLDLVPHLWQMVCLGETEAVVDLLPAGRHRPAGRSQEARRILLPAGIVRRAVGEFRPPRAAAAARQAPPSGASTEAARDVRNRPFQQRRQMTDVRTGDGQRKRVFIRTYGCQMNVYDSDRMADVLRPLGYALSDTPEQADLVVLNTCHIREQASEKVYSELGRLRDIKLERRAEGARPHHRRRRLRRPGRGRGDRAPPARRRHRRRAAGLSPAARAAGRGRAQAGVRRAGKRLPGAGVLDTDFPAESKFDHLPAPRGRARRLGVPVDPGRLRQVLHLLRRALYARRRIFAAGCGGAGRGAPALAAAGAIEITLLGQNVNAYHGEARRSMAARPGRWRA